MRRLMAIFTLAVFLFVSAFGGDILISCVEYGCIPVVIVRAPKAKMPECGSCADARYSCEIVECVPEFKPIAVSLNSIVVSPENSLAGKCQCKLPMPLLRAVVADPRNLSTERPPAKVMVSEIQYSEIKHISQFSYNNLINVHPTILTTVLRL